MDKVATELHLKIPKITAGAKIFQRILLTKGLKDEECRCHQFLNKHA